MKIQKVRRMINGFNSRYCRFTKRREVYTFNAITKAGALAANYPFATIDPNVGIVEVPDSRLLKLEEMVQPKRRFQQHSNLLILQVLLKVHQKVKV